MDIQPCGQTYLLTCHGTILTLDPVTGSISAARLLAVDHARLGLVLPPAALPPGIVLGRVPGGGYTLRAGTGFLTVNINGLISWSAQDANDWEIFLPIACEQIGRLRVIMTNHWHVAGADGHVPPRQIGFSTGFLFHIGPFLLDLRQGLAGADFGTGATAKTFTHSSPIAAFGFTDRAGQRHEARLISNPSPCEPPQIWIDPLGNTGNRALQYLAAAGLAAKVPGAVVTNIQLPEWGMNTPAPRPAMGNAVRLGRDCTWFDSDGLADCLRRRAADAVILDGYTFNLEHYPARQACRAHLGPMQGGAAGSLFGPDELVCSVRGAEILHAAHEDYVVLPPAYYRLLASLSGLKLMFFGQVGSDAYTQSLRDAFPGARFVSGQDPATDFETLRRCRHIAPSISTFAWLAAWLSDAESIWLPAGGLFNPVQNPGQTYLPLDEPTYRFILLPYGKAVSAAAEPAKFARQQSAMGQAAHEVSRDGLRAICARAALMAQPQPTLGGFDPGYYITRYPDAALAAYGGRQNALDHYLHTGFAEQRRPADFDRNAYCTAYPDAGLAIAEGWFRDPLHHYTARGWALGYRPRP